MTASTPMPTFLYEVISQLRRRGLPLGIDDCAALRLALAAGFGWASHTAMLELCIALWAKSAAEEGIVRAAFARVVMPEWSTEDNDPGSPQPEVRGETAPTVSGVPQAWPDSAEPSEPFPERDVTTATQQVRRLALAPPRTGRYDQSLVLAPQYPVTERQVAQTWRGLRRAVRRGPKTDLDVAATVDLCARTGVAAAPVLVPARRNSARLLLLIDRQGSMTPFHDYVEHVRRAIERAGRVSSFAVAYFHNTAGRSLDHGLLAELPDPFAPGLDAVAKLIRPLSDGLVYDDPDLTEPRPLAAIVDAVTHVTGAVVISDAGAARGTLNIARLLDTLAFGKAMQASSGAVAWLNPVPPSRWRRTTAEQVARHLPMFPLTREGMYRAVDVLRGRPITMERPL